MSKTIFGIIILFVTGLAVTSFVFAQVNNFPVTTPSDVPEFIFQLPRLPRFREVIGLPTRRPVIRERTELVNDQCPVKQLDPHCDIDGVLNSFGAYRLEWICADFPDRCQVTRAACLDYPSCDRTSGEQTVLKVSGTGFLENLPVGKSISEAGAGVIKITAPTGLLCADKWSFVYSAPPVPVQPPTSDCQLSTKKEVTEEELRLTNIPPSGKTQILLGTLPYLRFVANDNGNVRVKASVPSFVGGTCLSSSQFSVSLYDNNVLVGGPFSGSAPWTESFSSFFVTSATTHYLELRISAHCSSGSFVVLKNVSMTVEGPLGKSCPSTQSVAPRALKFLNNKLVEGSFPQYSLTAQKKERVTVRGYTGAFSGGPCQSPAFNAILYDDLNIIDNFNGTEGGWSRTYQSFTADPGSEHVLRMEVHSHCASGGVGSTLFIPNVGMEITREQLQ